VTAERSPTRWIVWAIFVAVVLVLPQIFTSGYMTNALIDSVRWIIFALSFDLVAGHVGAVSLGHTVFFGLGAYFTALAAQEAGLGFAASLAVTGLVMAVLALAMGFAFFRISGVTFAIGTLGAAIIAQLIVNNAFNITGGPLCVKGVSRPELALPFSDAAFKITQPVQYYYLLLPLLVITIVIYQLITTERIGRAFTAVREDVVRASADGVYPLRYKQLAFAVGAAIAGALGSFQAQYITVVCPSDLALDLMTTLLIIVFVGGIGRMRGVIIGAIIFSALPRILESGGQVISPAYQQIAYGLILVLVMIFLPQGIDGLLTDFSNRRKKSRTEVSS
jgi:branched-chain amino acid transport system permease protein